MKKWFESIYKNEIVFSTMNSTLWEQLPFEMQWGDRFKQIEDGRNYIS